MTLQFSWGGLPTFAKTANGIKCPSPKNGPAYSGKATNFFLPPEFYR